MPKEDKGRLPKKELEDHEPGATRDEVMAALKKTAKPTKEPTPRQSNRRGK